MERKSRMEIPVGYGDGVGPEIGPLAWKIGEEAARIFDGMELVPKIIDIGWDAFKKHGDTLPKESIDAVLKAHSIFSSGVGDKRLDETIAREHPEMTPEKRVLLALRKLLGLLYNHRPVRFYKELCNISKLNMKPQDITMDFFRYSAEDVYTGTEDLLECFPKEVREKVGLKLKAAVTGKEKIVTSVSYFTRKKLIPYFRAVFSYAKDRKRSVIVVDKANITGVDTFWRLIAKEVSEEFPSVPVSYLYIDAASALLVMDPAKFDAVIACQNMQGDSLTDLAAATLGSLGLMQSLAVNPSTGAFFCESGAGSANDIAGKDIANPLGRIGAIAMMLRHIGAPKGADAIEQAVRKVLVDGWRTADLFREEVDDKAKLLGTKGMGAKVLEYLQKE